ncbi:ABC transporter permease [Aminobacter sp. UC22_36]|uniref:ABC transporter permease n=1 Tax=Aminobacter sp. UC22_36 TaxID=3374549 RepID=UPI003757C576
MEFVDTLINILNSTIRVSVPLLLACLAGLYSERAGVFDIGLEGKMLAGAFAGAAAAAVFASAWIGLLVAILVSVGMALVHGFASITHRGNQIVSGVAINFIAAGSTIILGQAWFQQGGRTPSLPPEARFGEIKLPGADALRDVPVIGQLYSGLLSGHSLLTYVAFLAVPFTWWVLFRTRFGLRLRAVGENPAAVDTAGISVAWLRYRAVICTGILTGLAGSYMALAQNAGFVKDMTAGRGYIALAALIFAKWKPVPAMFACLLFGFLDALSIRLQGTPLPIIGKVPVQLMQALPYILTVILLAGFIGKAIPPRAGGVPYVKER